MKNEVVLELEQIGVLPFKQKQGIGPLLISVLLKMVKKERAVIFLLKFKTNPIRSQW